VIVGYREDRSADHKDGGEDVAHRDQAAVSAPIGQRGHAQQAAGGVARDHDDPLVPQAA
jgi:hypothetical protein